MYYRLQNHCKLVAGAKRGAIYNFHSGKVYSINESAVKLLDACQTKTLEDILGGTSPDDPIVNFLDELTSKGVGSLFVNEPVQTSQQSCPRAPQKLDFLWLELTSACNNKCLHCYATSGPSVQDTDKVPHQRWLSLITEARQAGATAIQLIGGEPLLYPGWRELIVKAAQEGYEFIEIFTNATLIDDSCVEFFKEYNVNIATTIYADNAETHDKVTLHKGSFVKTMTAVKKLLAAEIPLRIASIIMKANEHEVENIKKLCGELGVTVTPPDVVRPTGRGDDHVLLPESYSRPGIKPPFYTDESSFVKAQHYHSCLGGILAITAAGDVIPCIFARDHVCGNILSTPLEKVLNEPALLQSWQTTKDQVEKCKDCEFRYACADCRPLAQGSDPQKRWLACSHECLYDPYTGKWKENTDTAMKEEEK